MDENIPEKVEEHEILARFIYRPDHIKSDDKLKWNAFRPQSGESTVSVERYSYCNTTYCKKKAKKALENTNKIYYGLCVLGSYLIYNKEKNIVYSPEFGKYHADIELDYVFKKGMPPNPQIKELLEHWSKKAKLYVDPNPTHDEWNEKLDID